MNTLLGFLSAWDRARATFGAGLPHSGAEFDQSAGLEALRATTQTATAHPPWTGAAAGAYDAARTAHIRVLTELAVLDRRLAAHIDESADIVTAGRRSLDDLRRSVTDAAASVPPGHNHDQLLLTIVAQGLSTLTDIVTSSQDELAWVAGEIRGMGRQWEALEDQATLRR